MQQKLYKALISALKITRIYHFLRYFRRLSTKDRKFSFVQNFLSIVFTIEKHHPHSIFLEISLFSALE